METLVGISAMTSLDKIDLVGDCPIKKLCSGLD